VLFRSYEVLKDKEKRKLYDTYGQNWQQAASGQQQYQEHYAGQGGSGGYGNNYQRTYSFHQGDGDGDQFDFDDFISNIFRQGGVRGGGRTVRDFQAPGQEREAEITVSLADVYYGATKNITMQSYGLDDHGGMQQQGRTLQVKIPKGITDGSVIRLAGQGEKGRGGGSDGDLLIKINVAPDPRFGLDGHDLYTTVAVSPWEAALGAKVAVQTMEGSVTLTVPKGSQNGRKMRLRGKGLPKRREGAGDLFVELDVRLPKNLSDTEERLLRELAEKSSFNPRDHYHQRNTKAGA
jgi:curved DNA-binding protein